MMLVQYYFVISSQGVIAERKHQMPPQKAILRGFHYYLYML